MKFITVFLMLITFSFTLISQETINTTGGIATGSDGSVSYSIGQIFYETVESTDGYVIQGVQQPFEISIITEISTSKGITLLMDVYPNPTTDYLILNIVDFDMSNLNYYLYDASGKLIKSEIINTSLTKIEMKELEGSIFFVKISSNNSEIKTFKVLKI